MFQIVPDSVPCVKCIISNNHSWHPWLSELLGEETTMELIKQAHAVTQEEMADMGAEQPKAKAATA